MKESKEEREPTCQDCKSQTNKPSYCGAREDFVARKAEPCKLFTPKRRK